MAKMYEFYLLPDEIMVILGILWHSFTVPITREEIIFFNYDFCPIQHPPLVVFVYECTKSLGNTFSRNFSFMETASLIKLIKDQVEMFSIIEIFCGEDVNMSFIVN